MAVYQQLTETLDLVSLDVDMQGYLAVYQQPTETYYLVSRDVDKTDYLCG